MSFATEHHVHMAAQLYRYRDLARAVLGPKFEPTMRDLAGALHRIASTTPIERADWWESEPDLSRVADGVAARVDRLKAIGNGQVPRCAATAWRMLTGGMSNTPNAR